MTAPYIPPRKSLRDALTAANMGMSVNPTTPDRTATPGYQPPPTPVMSTATPRPRMTPQSDLANALRGEDMGDTPMGFLNEVLNPIRQGAQARQLLGDAVQSVSRNRIARGVGQGALGLAAVVPGLPDEVMQGIRRAIPWSRARTGEPATVIAYRGEGGISTPLSPEWRQKLGRDYLLGDGIYAAPTERIAQRFGDPSPMRVSLKNPYVLDNASPSDIQRLDVDALKKSGYDGVIIKSGTSGMSLGNEPMAQVVSWGGDASVQRGVGFMDGDFEVGAVVDLTPKHPLLASQVGDVKSAKIVSFSPWGHPEIKIGKKKIALGPDDYKMRIP